MSHLIRTIVVGVASLDDQDPRTGNGDADPVLGPAVRLASAVGAELHVIHAFEVPEEQAGPQGGSFQPQSFARQVEERLEAQLATIPGGGAAHCRAVEGPAAERLYEIAEEVEADLLVVGASRRGRAWSGILGSTAGQVLDESLLPVLVVHRPFGAGVLRVLLVADLTAGGIDAMRSALAVVAALFGRDAPELRCLHVVECDALLPASPSTPALEAAGRARLDLFLADLQVEDRRVEARVRVGDPAREIAYEAAEWGADLVVVATHTHPVHGRRPLGRVAFATVRGAPCNVLAIPAFGTVGEGVTALRSSREAVEVSSAAG